jgi:predicted alpha/beta superfamily hydrolase
MRLLCAISYFFLFISCKSHFSPPAGEYETLHSSETNDDYIIEVKKPADYDEKRSYHIVFVADGTLGLGEYILGRNEKWKATLPSNCVFVTIGHQGNWEEKRRRDFIPSDISKNSEENFGKADKFYAFLKSELVPYIDKQFPHPTSKVFIGHSFSGLFCLYAALKNEKLFDRYFAISPSVWANDEELLKIEEAFAKHNNDLPARINIYAGGLEVFNKVLSSATEFYDKIRAHDYKNLSVTMEKIGWANHFSIRKPALDRILALLSAENK